MVTLDTKMIVDTKLPKIFQYFKTKSWILGRFGLGVVKQKGCFQAWDANNTLSNGHLEVTQRAPSLFFLHHLRVVHMISVNVQ